MRIEFAFDDDKIISSGYDKKVIYENLQENFKNSNLPCIKNDNDSLVFKDNGTEDCYAKIFKLAIGYLKTDWFLKLATKCNFYKFDDENFEDILK